MDKKEQDPRATSKDKLVNCFYCNSLTMEGKVNCWKCLEKAIPERHRSIAIMEGSGSHMISVARATAAKDYASKNQADLLQPYKYEKQYGQPGKHVVNPDYAKIYGDPTKVTKSK